MSDLPDYAAVAIEIYLEQLGDNFATSFTSMADEVHANAKDKGWWDEDRNNGEMIALMHSELSEALEGFRHGNPPDGPLCVSLDFYRPRKAGDLDNLLKVTIDALIGHAYLDDNQIVEIHAMRHDDKADPRVEVVIQAVQP